MVDNLIQDLYNELKSIFKEYTTHNWKNGWQNEGDRSSKSLTIVDHKPGNNLYLLRNYVDSIELRNHDSSLVIEVKEEYAGKHRIRVDIINKFINQIYYYVDNLTEWEYHKQFIIDVCKIEYDSKIQMRNLFKFDRIFGEENPQFIKEYKRDSKLKFLLDD